MVCCRCQGLLNKETWIDLQDDMGILTIEVLHCLNCGEVIDPTILRHRLSVPAPLIGHARVAPKTALGRIGPTNPD